MAFLFAPDIFVFFLAQLVQRFGFYHNNITERCCVQLS